MTSLHDCTESKTRNTKIRKSEKQRSMQFCGNNVQVLRPFKGVSNGKEEFVKWVNFKPVVKD